VPRTRRLTIPNLITILRFLLVPCVVLALLSGRIDLGFAGFLVAGLSDAIDGFLARQLNQRSELGAYLDPMADKLLLVSVFVVLGYMGELPLWLVIAAVARDALIVLAVLLSTVMGRPVAVRPLYVSKVNTTVQIILALLVLAELAFSFQLPWARSLLILACGALTGASAVAYLVPWLRHMAANGESTTPSR
jgi:cardiolipin synthase